MPLVFLSFNFYQKDEANAINRFLVWYVPSESNHQKIHHRKTVILVWQGF
jgi:hypothetical protein